MIVYLSCYNICCVYLKKLLILFSRRNNNIIYLYIENINDIMEASDEIFEELGYVMSSKHRPNVMKSLKERMKMPSQICQELDLLPNHISMILGELKDHDLVVCVNPNAAKGRLYRLTEKGRAVLEYLE